MEKEKQYSDLSEEEKKIYDAEVRKYQGFFLSGMRMIERKMKRIAILVLIFFLIFIVLAIFDK